MSKRTEPIHPGEHLAEFLEEYGISQYRLAKDISVSARRINEIVRGQRAVTADTALRLGCYFDMSAQFWMNLQASYDLARAMQTPGWKRKSIRGRRDAGSPGDGPRSVVMT
ncbi:Addiction module antidote protein, HigA [mine drainage metagenome]|uniref:Addiction module antidote protein, HigA n=1 Tax=mine drainage metagenome TaxID=410659 RepID=T1C2X4_9ZZZZ